MLEIILTGEEVYQQMQIFYETDITDDKSQYKNIFNKWVAKLQKKHGKDNVVFDFSAYHFKPDTWISSYHGDLDFRHLLFPRTYVEHAIFEGNVDFRDIHFKQDANFSKAQFHQDVDFSKAQFHQDVDFSKAQFHQDVDFSKAQFHQDVDFSQAQFHYVALFRNIKFHKEAYFSGVEFHINADCW